METHVAHVCHRASPDAGSAPTILERQHQKPHPPRFKGDSLRIPTSVMISLMIPGLAGCANQPADIENSEVALPTFTTYENGQIFSLAGCKGIEIAQKLLGSPEKNETQRPPPSWEDIYSHRYFSWSLEVLDCKRIGWGPIERGPISVGLEVHNAYAAPEACRAGLDETTSLRYIHHVYLDDPDVRRYASEWGLPASTTEFSYHSDFFDSFVLHMKPFGSNVSKVELHKTGTFEVNTSPIRVAFFWFQEEQVHRLTLQRESRTSIRDAAMVEMAPPTIPGNRPGPFISDASRLTKLHWVGELVTFSDPTCNKRVFS